MWCAKNVRELIASDLMSDKEANMDEFFDDKGHWAEKPQEWQMPKDALEQK